MYKKIAAILAGAAVLAAAGLALAAPAELNIYGASAEFTYWNAAAGPYLTHLGCTLTPATPFTFGATNNTGNSVKHGYIAGTACSSALVPVNSATSKRDLTIRFTSIASGEGLLAVGKNPPLETDITNYPTITSSTQCDTTQGQRAMLKDNTSNNLECHQVTVGASDVAGSNINQSVANAVYTNNGQHVITSAIMAQFNLPTATYNVFDQGFEVPFCLYVNNGVVAHHCLDTTGRWTGGYCTQASDCVNPNNSQFSGPLTCQSTATTVSNLSRLQTVMLFSGQVPTWKWLGDYFGQNNFVNDTATCQADPNGNNGGSPNNTNCIGTVDDIVTKICHRIPGSGTVATLDYTIMNAGGTKWGSEIVTAENTDATNPPLVKFNKSTGDQLTCIASASGAVGYADCDQKQTGITQVTYNGVLATGATIRNGEYDFYSPAHLYTYKTDPQGLNSVITDLESFLGNPANIPSSEVNWWTSYNEKWFDRAYVTSYPVQVGPPNMPVLP